LVTAFCPLYEGTVEDEEGVELESAIVPLLIAPCTSPFEDALPAGVPGWAVGSLAEPAGADIGAEVEVWAQAIPAVIKTAAEASKSERIFLSIIDL
jgi:hypothetical protein